MYIITVALLLVGGGVVLSLRSAGQMAETVKRQFNEEQLVVARNAANLIERELQVLKKEISIVSREIVPGPFHPEALNKSIQKTLTRVMEMGVRHMKIIDTTTRKIYTYMPKQSWTVDDISGHTLDKYLLIENKNIETVRITQPQKKYTQLSLELFSYLEDIFPKVLIVDLNLSWFLTPLLREARSGKTGYAWVIDEKGTFLYHPETDFIGQSAFEIRQEKNSTISFAKINFIQKEKMLMGQKGSGSYISGWHRGETGRIEKLIAFHPITVADIPSQQWFAAVVAPVSEVAGAVKMGYKTQFLLQGLIVAIIVMAASTLIFIEKRWSGVLERKVSERTEELKRSEEKYRSLVESAEDFIFTVDEKGFFVTMNSFTADFFGGSKGDFIGKHLSTIFSPSTAEKQMSHINHVYCFGKSMRSEIELSMGPHQFWMSANFMPLKDDEKCVNGVLCIARDITENKNLEKQLVNTEKLASLGTLAAGVAHEINNPLGVILGFCDLLLQKSDTYSQTYDDLKIIERQGHHCKEIVENLLSFSRSDKSGLETVDLNTCLDDLFKVVGHTLEMHQIELTTELAAGLPKIKADPRQLQQVFLNVINNAVSAMGHGGVLKIQSGFDRAEHKVTVRISDTGRGIEPENMDRIFEPFFTTKPEGEGTGLGLFVSYGIVNRLGGTLTCVSRPAGGVEQGDGNQGTTFTVTLPVYPL
jgi:two-component system NtrC family sensor kinase